MTTPRAILFNGRSFTLHHFVRREPADYVEVTGKDGGRGTAIIYACAETGIERRWGLELPSQSG